jgi:hypothetical protein
MSDIGQPVRIKFIPSLAFVATRHRPEPDRPLKPPGKNWAKAFEKRYPETAARRVMALDWNCHEKNIAVKVTHWFQVIETVLNDPAILAVNVYNMDETGVMLSMLGSVKVLVGKGDKRNYRGARVKRTTITAIECISGDGRYLNPMVFGRPLLIEVTGVPSLHLDGSMPATNLGILTPILACSGLSVYLM